jgi:potassium/hydrogen antiporter
VDVQDVLRDVGLILAAGLLSAPVAAVLRLPVMLVLVAAGALIGPPALALVDSPLDGLGAQLVFTLGVSLILFHGGLQISLRVISQTAVGLGLLVLPGVLVTALIVAVVAAPVFSVPFTVALLLGSVLAATDPAILIPLFDRLRIRRKVAQTVIAESAFNDPTGTILALTVAAAVVGGGVTTSDTIVDFGQSLVLGALFGIVGGVLLVVMLSSHSVGVWAESPAVVVLALVSLQYFTADELGGSSYLAAFVMGLVVANSDLFRIGRNAEHAHLLESFMTQVSEIAVLAVFITLGINLPFAALQEYFWGGLLVMIVFIFVARPVTVLVCLLPDRRGRWTWQELLFLSWCRETGVVPAAIASLLLADQVEGAEIAVALVAMAIVVTLSLQATTAGPLARRLGLSERDGVPSGPEVDPATE